MCIRDRYYKRSKTVISESQRAKLLEDSILYLRMLLPRAGGVKIHRMLAEELGHEITGGRDAFLRFYSSHGFSLPRPKRIRTTDSRHLYLKYPNLLQGVEAREPNQVWVADITYVWIEGDVLYLHLLTDAYSHAIIGWCLADTLEADNTVEALEMGIRTAGGDNLCGTTHHSDRGVQYACAKYVDALRSHHIRISMTERYSPTDNAVAERVNGILKTEWIYCGETYRDREQARAAIEQIIRLYNDVRPHMSIGMKTPMEVYRGAEPGPNLWKHEK